MAPNITPDRETGIGGWSDEQFISALKDGQLPDHRRLYPAMPFPYYTKMSRQDVLALRAYLNTIEPVMPWIPISCRFPLACAPLCAYGTPCISSLATSNPNANKSPVWNRGAYLVEALGHCQACHTPKTFLGGDKKDKAFRGLVIQGWTAPDITNATATGLGSWSVKDIADYLKTGHNRFVGASGPMAEEVQFSSSNMTVEDLEAVGTYLKDLPGSTSSPSPRSSQEPDMVAGNAIYEDDCSACHKTDGTGYPSYFRISVPQRAWRQTNRPP